MSVFDIKVDEVELKAYTLDNGSCIIDAEYSFCSLCYGQNIKAVSVERMAFVMLPMSHFNGNLDDDRPAVSVSLHTEIGVVDIRAERIVVLNPGVFTVKGDDKEFDLHADSASAWIAMQAAMHVFEDRKIVSDLLYPEKDEDRENPWS